MSPRVELQALRPREATVLDNDFGTAPGLFLPANCGGKPSPHFFLLPGPPRELRPMFVEQVVPLLESKFGRPADYACCVLKTTGMAACSVIPRRLANSRNTVTPLNSRLSRSVANCFCRLEANSIKLCCVSR